SKHLVIAADSDNPTFFASVLASEIPSRMKGLLRGASPLSSASGSKRIWRLAPRKLNSYASRAKKTQFRPTLAPAQSDARIPLADVKTTSTAIAFVDCPPSF